MEMKKYKLQDLGTIITGKTPLTKQEDNFNGNIPFVTPEDITNNVYNLKKTGRYITEKGFASIKANTISGKSILVGCIGSDMGNVGFINSECATNQQINSITDIKSDFVPEYIYYNLCTKKEFFRKNAGSTTTPLLPKSVFSLLDIFCCDFESQQKISAVLSSLDDKIALNNRINAKLEQMAKRLYDYWFVQFDFPNADGKPYKSNGGKMVWNEELKREIPEGWEVKSINDISVSYRGVGYTADDEKSETDENVVLILRGNNISNNHIVFDSNTVYLDKTFVSPDQEIHKFDLVMTMSSGSKEHVGKSAMFLYDSSHSYGAFCNKITPNEDCQYFLENYLHSEYFKKYIKVTCSGTGINNLTNEHFDKAKFAFPDDEVLKAFNEKMNAIYEKGGILEQENLKLTSMRDKLLPLLMNGQVVVE